MLRILTVLLFTMSATSYADTKDLANASDKAAELQEEARAALDEAKDVDLSETLPSFGDAIQRSESVPETLFPDLGAELTDPETLATIGVLMDEADSLAEQLGVGKSASEGLAVYVFASFSMPAASLRSLIEQGELAGAPVVLRGLVNNSIEDTMAAVLELYGEDRSQESGAVIDPTLFERFGVDQVPSFVVAEYAAAACTAESCPTPDHVQLAGDVPLRYALDRIALARPAFRHELRAVMNRLEPERQW